MSSPSSSYLLGWDVGGAHLKAALIDSQGRALQVIQLPCPLWRGIDTLVQAMQQVLAQLPQTVTQHAVTMTGELADIFPDRHSGVLEIADVMSQLLPGTVKFYAGQRGFVVIADVAYHTASIASANWLASASLVANRLPEGIFVDIGSTTADLVPFSAHSVQQRGSDDATRMQFEELVYTGVVRTPVMAITQRLPVAGEWVTLAAEHFATMADVYRLTDELPLEFDLADTADGQGKSVPESARRLARMLGRDASDAAPDSWRQLAQACKHAQLVTLQQAVLRQLSRLLISAEAPLVGAGAGSFLVQQLALSLGRPYLDSVELVTADDNATRKAAAVCLPAYAVAYLCTQVGA